MPRHLHVLLADADIRARETVKAVLHRMLADVEVEEVSTAEGLDRSLGRSGSDLVIADTHLPGGTRLGVLRAIGAHHPHIPAILFTAASREEVVMAAVNAGVDDYVLKSGNCVRRLESAIRSALYRRGLEGAEGD